MSNDPSSVPKSDSPLPSSTTPDGAAAISPDVLKAALKAFKKRLKLTQLDDASRIGHGPMSGGHGSSIAGITPPDQYPRAVWEELVKQGKLKRAGQGMYSPA
jgi:hypothetical protein